jgi:hypothetical protein
MSPQLNSFFLIVTSIVYGDSGPKPIDFRDEDGRFLVSASCVTI